MAVYILRQLDQLVTFYNPIMYSDTSKQQGGIMLGLYFKI